MSPDQDLGASPVKPPSSVTSLGPASQLSRQDLAKRRLGLLINDKWQLTELLGVGGMAAVYAAVHRNGSKVAIKLLPFSLATGAELCERLLREGYLANRIEHPAVVRVLDDHIDYEREHAYLVMDLLKGETARQRVERLGTFEPRQAVELMLELTDCLMAAHAANIIHRDIKPENLFLTEQGLRVLDFGIARALDAASNLTQTGTSLGTPAYMSPEQARGKQSEISFQSDLYSAGATLYFLLTADTLHKGENPMELMVRAAWTPAVSVAELCPTLPSVLVRVIDRCCKFDPKERFADASALRDALLEAKATLEAEPWAPRATLTPVPSLRGNAVTLSAAESETLSADPIPMQRTGAVWMWMGLIAAGALVAALSVKKSPPPSADSNPSVATAPSATGFNPAAVSTAASAPVSRPQAIASSSPTAAPAPTQFSDTATATAATATTESSNLSPSNARPSNARPSNALARPVSVAKPQPGVAPKRKQESASRKTVGQAVPDAESHSHRNSGSFVESKSPGGASSAAPPSEPSKRTLRLHYDGFRKPATTQ